MSESTRHSGGQGHHFAGPGALDRALSLVRFLRRECPWDQAQTAQSLIPYLLEETHEVVDAIREGSAGELEGHAVGICSPTLKVNGRHTVRASFAATHRNFRA